MLAQRVSRLWFGSVVAGCVLFGSAGTASAAPPTCDEPARVLYQLPAGMTWTHPQADCTDPDGDPVYIRITDEPDFGTFDPAGDVLVTDPRSYTAKADAAGNLDTLKYKAFAGREESVDEYQVDVWILPANVAPVCEDLALDMQAGTTVAIAPKCVDADNDIVTLHVVKWPEHGTYDPPSRTYTAAPRFAGRDTMTFKVRDEWRLESAERTITITVGQAPGQPTATGDKTAPTLSLQGKSPLKSRKALRRGIRLTATASEAGRIVIEALLSAKTAQKLGVETRIGSIARNIKAGKTTFKLRLYRKFRDDLADARRVKLRLVARMVDAAGNLRTKRLRITLER